ncbi:MAG: nucleotidyltransferase family protein [Verrucomicrobiota bacterium]|nr:nucleotidyltransferase family protein [Limisphaera sp.]MDW8381517.1 nucleotidyltransferase family protein [Verrucomicrobiota bacterium]
MQQLEGVICAILLAAGQSRRMGTPKLLLPWKNTVVLGHVVDAFLEADVDPLLVVVSPESEPLRRALAGKRVQWVENPRLGSEMLESVRCGLRAAPAAVRTFLVSPADMPGLHPGLIRQLLDAHQARRARITVPVWQGKRGHPLVFESGFRAELLMRHDGVGLRGLLQAHPAEVYEWPAPDSSPCWDLDTPDDYHRWAGQ